MRALGEGGCALSDIAVSGRGKWVDEPYDDPRLMSIPLRPPGERILVDEVGGLDMRDSVCMSVEVILANEKD